MKTWDPNIAGRRAAAARCGTAWPTTRRCKLVYIGTANAAPYNIHLGGRHGGDDLYAASIVAIHADDGSLAWYYQTTPGDRWDFDSTQKLILADLDLGGKRRKVLMQAAKNGFYYVLDRATGELLSAQQLCLRELDSRHRSEDRAAHPRSARGLRAGPTLVFPSEAGAHSWQPMAFDPRHALTFIPVMEAGNVLSRPANAARGLVEGQFTDARISARGLRSEAPCAPCTATLPSIASSSGVKTDPASRGFLRAWSVSEHRVVWEAQTATSWDGGVLATAGGLVFQGDANGYLNVYAADTGERLASIALGSSMMAAPITYRVNGTQYSPSLRATAAARSSRDPLDPASAAYRYGNDGRIIALKLGGPTPPLPPLAPIRPPRSAGTAHRPRRSPRGRFSTIGSAPAATSLAAGFSRTFGGSARHARRCSTIVLGGAYAMKGMGRFDDVLTPADAQAIHA